MAGCSLRVTCFTTQRTAGPEETEPTETELLVLLSSAERVARRRQLYSHELVQVPLRPKSRTWRVVLSRRRCGDSKSKGFTQRVGESNGLRDYGWAEALVKSARMTLTSDGKWTSFHLANNTTPLSVTGSVIAPPARMKSTQRWSLQPQ